ncbi:MAG: hypothetical protein IKD07_07200 [Clostridia bacterium]|nr:hypothetical protein [Clostridia bacterium]
MYSRSYGSIESERKPDGVSVPPDYNGSLYPNKTERQEIRKKQEEIPAKEENAEPVPEHSLQREPTASRQAGSGLGLLEKFSAEDIILFILVFALLKDDNGDPGVILAVILALLLL